MKSTQLISFVKERHGRCAIGTAPLIYQYWPADELTPDKCDYLTIENLDTEPTVAQILNHCRDMQEWLTIADGDALTIAIFINRYYQIAIMHKDKTKISRHRYDNH